MEQEFLDKTKVILKLFTKFLEKSDFSGAMFDFDYDGNMSDPNRFWCQGGNGMMSTPIPMDNILEKIVDENMVGDIEDEESGQIAEPWGYKMLITPEGNLTIEAIGTGYGDGDSESSEEELDESLLEEFKKEGITEVHFDFNGGGDSGYIESEGTTNNSTPVTASKDLEEVMYGMLENYGGWEINEGSHGQFTINVEEGTINLIFIWHREFEFTEQIFEWDFAE
jgi:hypothetical protein